MRGRLHGWMRATPDVGLLDEIELLEREIGARFRRDLRQSPEHYGRLFEAANFSFRCLVRFPI